MGAARCRRPRRKGCPESPPADPAAAAKAAHLRYVSDDLPGIRRVRAGRGFRYVGPDSRPVRDPETLTRIRSLVLPPLDRGVAALLDDLAATGLLDETLVLMLGEFGRTPKISTVPGARSPGRDHWAPCFFGLFAGAGVRGGQVIGRSDKIGAYPATNPYSPDDVGATVYQVLGVNPTAEVRDRQNRPVQLNRGAVIEALFTGAAG